MTTGEPVSASFDTSTVGCAKDDVGGGRGTRAACCVSASVVCVEWEVGSSLLSRPAMGEEEGCVDVVSEVLGVRSAGMEREKSYGEREEVGEAHRILYHLRPLARVPLTQHHPCPLPSPVDSSRYRAALCYGRPGPRAPVPIENRTE